MNKEKQALSDSIIHWAKNTMPERFEYDRYADGCALCSLAKDMSNESSLLPIVCWTCVLPKYGFDCGNDFSPWWSTNRFAPKANWNMLEVLLYIWYSEYDETFIFPEELTYENR